MLRTALTRAAARHALAHDRTHQPEEAAPSASHNRSPSVAVARVRFTAAPVSWLRRQRR